MFHRFELMVNTLFHIIKITKVARVCCFLLQSAVYAECSQYYTTSSVPSRLSLVSTRQHLHLHYHLPGILSNSRFLSCGYHSVAHVIQWLTTMQAACRAQTVKEALSVPMLFETPLAHSPWPLFASVCHCIQQNAAEVSGSIRCFECVDDAIELATTIRCTISGWRLLRVITSWSGRRNFTSFSLSRLIARRSWASLFFVSPLLSSG